MKRTRRNPSDDHSSREVQHLSSGEMRAAARAVFDLAGNTPAALCGGYAMILYGSRRMTSDVDFLGKKRLPIASTGMLSFGGYKYEVNGVQVDWIVREDDQAFVYEAALEDRAELGKSGLMIVRPEWLALIKMLARRPKDMSDLLTLLRAPGLVNRGMLEKHIRRVFGKYSFNPLNEMSDMCLEADMMKAQDLTDREYKPRRLE